ncbi:MAG: hypothetical protein EBX52_12565 [Proteobacteria bacterium]|nr:hypothetical protein [Pseudomonadota bacterium]
MITLKYYLIHVQTGKAVPLTGALTVGREGVDPAFAEFIQDEEFMNQYRKELSPDSNRRIPASTETPAER